MPKPTPRAQVIERLAMAVAWDFSVGKAMTPRLIFMAQTEGCKEYLRLMAKDWLAGCTKAGLRITLAPTAKKKAKR